MVLSVTEVTTAGGTATVICRIITSGTNVMIAAVGCSVLCCIKVFHTLIVTAIGLFVICCSITAATNIMAASCYSMICCYISRAATQDTTAGASSMVLAVTIIMLLDTAHCFLMIANADIVAGSAALSSVVETTASQMAAITATCDSSLPTSTMRSLICATNSLAVPSSWLRWRRSSSVQVTYAPFCAAMTILTVLKCGRWMLVRQKWQMCLTPMTTAMTMKS